VINICTNQNSEGTANLDATELLELLLLPYAIEILKLIESNPLGVDLNELIRPWRITYWTAYETIFPLMQYGLIFFKSNKFHLNPLGKGILAAIYMVEGAAQGKDILVFNTDDSDEEKENIMQIIDSITKN
jgi:hypothetical protein